MIRSTLVNGVSVLISFSPAPVARQTWIENLYYCRLGKLVQDRRGESHKLCPSERYLLRHLAISVEISEDVLKTDVSFVLMTAYAARMESKLCSATHICRSSDH
jgi:hypothetical protein